MSGGEEQLTGPDLTLGIAETELPKGGMMLGHAHGEAVLLVRVKDQVFAVGATCTHYGGPLAEGLVVGETIRCPWHHACFGLRTGATVRPPALNDLPHWALERREGKLFVGERIPAPAPPARRGKADPERVVILGGGAAGDCAAETLRREGFSGAITIVDPDPDAPYDRPNLSKDYLAGTAPEEWIPLHPPAFYADHDIAILHDRSAVEIDAGAHAVQLDDGTSLPFSALLIATGASPVQLPIPSHPEAPVHYLRTLADSRKIVAACAEARRAVVLGAGFIGLEVAASLRAREIDVTVVAPGGPPLARVMGSDLGRFIQALHERHGVRFRLDRTARQIGRDAVTLSDGEHLDADLVVIGAGVHPRDDLARAAGIKTSRGIEVNAQLETSVAGVYAAGDVASWPDPLSGERIRVEHWVVAQRMGQTVARNILGAGEAFTAVPFFWSQHYDAQIAYVGHARRWDEAQLDGDPEQLDCTVRFVADGREVAMASIFRDRASLERELAFEREIAHR